MYRLDCRFTSVGVFKVCTVVLLLVDVVGNGVPVDWGLDRFVMVVAL